MGRNKTQERRSPAHAEERLEERLPPAVAERGYELLRDRTELEAFIAAAARRDPRLAESERVALALEAGEPCAHLIATRAGEGVTTLAAGMVHALPTVPFALVEGFLAQQEALLRARIEVRKSLVDLDRSPVARAFRRPHRVTREEFERLRKLAPIFDGLLPEHIVAAFDVAKDVRPPTRPWPDEKCDALWRIYLRGVLFLTLDGFDCPLSSLLGLVIVPDVALSSRAIWHLVNRPEETLAEIARERDERRLPALVRLRAALQVLPALSTRHPSYHKDARHLAASMASVRPLFGAGAVRKHLAAELLLPLLARLGVVLPSPWTDENEKTNERIDHAFTVARELLNRDDGLPLFEIADAISPWHGRMIRVLDPLRAIGSPPETHVRPTSSLSDEERERVMLWRAILWTWPFPLGGVDPFEAELFALAPLEALAPLDEPDPRLSLSSGRQYVKDHLCQMKRLRKALDRPRKNADGSPRAAAPVVTQNAPCLCGSGKKHKRCCGMRRRRLRPVSR